jgi:hypothetical protein
VLETRSLLSGQEKYVTFALKMTQPFHGVTLVWTILRKHLPENITNEIRGMRAYRDMTGAVFDVAEEHIQRFTDVFDHLKAENRIEFTIEKAKTLPELREDDSSAGGYS